MIPLFVNLLKLKGKMKYADNFELYSEMLNNLPKHFVCTRCGVEGDYYRDGKYQRNIVYYSKNDININQTTIKRVKCKHCEHSHALLPAVFVPYLSFSVSFILHLMYYYNHSLDNLRYYSKDEINEMNFDEVQRECFEENFERKLGSIISDAV